MLPHILVVDDDVDLRETIASLLEEEGYEVSMAGNGLQALARLTAPPRPAAILFDLMMPESDGFDFREKQLADARIASIPAIAMTASGNADPRIGELQPAGFLRKPFDFEELLALLQKIGR